MSDFVSDKFSKVEKIIIYTLLIISAIVGPALSYHFMWRHEAELNVIQQELESQKISEQKLKYTIDLLNFMSSAKPNVLYKIRYVENDGQNILIYHCLQNNGNHSVIVDPEEIKLHTVNSSGYTDEEIEFDVVSINRNVDLPSGGIHDTYFKIRPKNFDPGYNAYKVSLKYQFITPDFITDEIHKISNDLGFDVQEGLFKFKSTIGFLRKPHENAPNFNNCNEALG